jgi:hypothetical protein
LTKDDKVKSWYGYVLIALVKERQKQALERAPPKSEASPPRPKAPPKPTAKVKKRRLRR